MVQINSISSDGTFHGTEVLIPIIPSQTDRVKQHCNMYTTSVWEQSKDFWRRFIVAQFSWSTKQVYRKNLTSNISERRLFIDQESKKDASL